jgi:hypothetical protein
MKPIPAALDSKPQVTEESVPASDSVASTPAKRVARRRIVRRSHLSRSTSTSEVEEEEPAPETSPTKTVAFTSLYLNSEELANRFLESPSKPAPENISLTRSSLRGRHFTPPDDQKPPELLAMSGLVDIAHIDHDLADKSKSPAGMRSSNRSALPSVRFI